MAGTDCAATGLLGEPQACVRSEQSRLDWPDHVPPIDLVGPIRLRYRLAEPDCRWPSLSRHPREQWWRSPRSRRATRRRSVRGLLEDIEATVLCHRRYGLQAKTGG